MRTAYGVVVFALAWVAASALVAAADPATSAYHWHLPSWAAPPVVPDDNPMSDAKVALGRYLFYDKRLSGNETYSCGTCHQQRLGFSDPNITGVGATGERNVLRTMTLTNVGYSTVFTWANPRRKKLEPQMLVPMFGEHPVELGLHAPEDQLYPRLRADARYMRMFAEAFPADKDPITIGNVNKAIASFERTMISLNSPYDRYHYGGDQHAISESAKRGEKLFFSDTMKCSQCHSGANFSDDTADARSPVGQALFHNIGLYNLGSNGAYPADAPGVVEITNDPNDMGKFKTPTLRNVAVRAPYMHDGSIADLDGVLDHFRLGGRTIVTGPNAGDGSRNPNKDPLMTGFELTPTDRGDLLAFLQSLTDESFLTNPALSDPFVAEQH
jgi:cytochrome c peroxidase